MSATLRGPVLADAPPPPTPRLSAIQLAGQRVVFAFDGTELPRNLKLRVRRGEAAGVILFGPNVRSVGQVRRMTRELQAIRRPRGLQAPLIVMADQEGGLVKRLPGAPHRSPPQMAATGRPTVARAEGRATARTLAAAGANVDLAPVVDVARPGSQMEREGRSFGRNPTVVGRYARAFSDGLRAGGIASTAKHFPGFGAASANTDSARVVVGSSVRRLRGRDEPPFVTSRTDLVMTSSAVYPAFSRAPALLSRRVVTGELRQRLEFAGVVVTDSLDAGALAGRRQRRPPRGAGGQRPAAVHQLPVVGAGGGAAGRGPQGRPAADRAGAGERHADPRSPAVAAEIGLASMALPPLLSELLTTHGPSGYEAAPAAVWRRHAEAFAEVESDALGSSTARVAGTGEGPTVAIVGHIDEIGLIVTHIDDKGFLWFKGVGGWDPLVLIGQRIELATRDGVVAGVVARKAIHLLKEEDRKRAPSSRSSTSTSAPRTATRPADASASATSR